MKKAEEDTLERLSAIDLRLEKAFRPSGLVESSSIVNDSTAEGKSYLEKLGVPFVAGTPAIKSPRRLHPLSKSNKSRGKTDQLDVSQEGSAIHCLLSHVGVPKSQSKQEGNQVKESVRRRKVDRWVDQLVAREEDPVKVGRECIEVLGLELDECFQFLDLELQFLHSLCVGGGDATPIKTAENCLMRKEKILHLWRDSHKVLWQVIQIYDEERRVYLQERDSDEFIRKLKRRVGDLTMSLGVAEAERDEARSSLDEFQTYFEHVSQFEEQEESNVRVSMSKLRAKQHEIEPSGVSEFLSKLYDQMMVRLRQKKLADKLRKEEEAKYINGRDEDDEVDEELGMITGSFRVNNRRLSTLSSTKGLEQEKEEDPFDFSQNRNRKSFNMAADIPEEGELKEEDSVSSEDEVENSSDGTEVELEENKPVHPKDKSNSDADSGDRKEERKPALAMKKKGSVRNSLMVEEQIFALSSQLDNLQISHMIANMLEKMSSKDLQSTVLSLGNNCRDEIGSVLLEAVIDGKQSAFVKNLFKTFQGKQRAELLLEFVKTLPVEEIQMFFPGMAEIMGAKQFHDLVGRVSFGDGAAAILEQHEIEKEHEEMEVETEDCETQTEPVEIWSASEEPGSAIGVKMQSTRALLKELKNTNEAEGLVLSAIGKEVCDGWSSAPQSPKKKKNPQVKQVAVVNRRLLQSADNVSIKVLVERANKVSLPWEKYLTKPKGHCRKIDASQMENDIIGEVFMKKVIADKSNNAHKSSHSMTKATLHYFTQKYGLKKLAEEYLYGVVDCIRQNHDHSSRIELFGRLVGIVDPDNFSPLLSEVVSETLALAYRHDQISKLYEHGTGKTFIKSVSAMRAVRTIFLLVEGDIIRDKSGNFEEPISRSDVDSSIRTWSIPANLRQRLIKWVEANSKAQFEVDSSSSSDIKVVNTDEFLKEVVDVFVAKLAIDSEMVGSLFRAYDKDNNGVLTFDEFTHLMNQCQPCPPLDEAQIMDLWIDINDSEDDDDDDSVTVEGFTRVIMQKNLQLPYWRKTD